MASSRMEISGGRSEFDIDDEHDFARTIAASFFILFSTTLICLFKLHSNLFGAFTTH